MKLLKSHIACIVDVCKTLKLPPQVTYLLWDTHPWARCYLALNPSLPTPLLLRAVGDPALVTAWVNAGLDLAKLTHPDLFREMAETSIRGIARKPSEPWDEVLMQLQRLSVDPWRLWTRNDPSVRYVAHNSVSEYIVRGALQAMVQWGLTGA